jgi:DNA end-binding protein Ku
VRDEKAYLSDIPNPRVPRDMIKLAEHILDSKAAHFDPRKFKDQYESALRKLVRKKAAGKKIEVPEPEERPSNVIDLMDALRRSAGKGGKHSARGRAGTRKHATRHKKAA